MDFAEAAAIGESFKQGLPVILNLTRLKDSHHQRMIDFCGGMTFVTGGRLTPITDTVYLVGPAWLELTKQMRSQLAESHHLGE
jgi:cell division inhibitor SepF